MSEVEDLQELNSASPQMRAVASLRLKDSFSEEVGTRLILLLLRERDSTAFRIACDVVIPKWIVRLEQELGTMTEWPFDPDRTAWLARALGGWVLPSFEAHIEQFYRSDDWRLRLAALSYSHDKMRFIQDARATCRDFLGQWQSIRDIGALAVRLGMQSIPELVSRVKEIDNDLRPLE